MFRLEIETEGAAFRNPMTGEPEEIFETVELRRILKSVRDAVCCGNKEGTIIDINGNKVGSWSR